jgi:hypothetical protein
MGTLDHPKCFPARQTLGGGHDRGMRKLSISEISSNSGDVVHPANPGVTCIVGANNVGKSQVLRDLLVTFESTAPRRVALGEVAVDPPALGDDEDLEAWMFAHGVRLPQPAPGGVLQYTSILGGQNLGVRDFEGFLNRPDSYLGVARQWFCWSATAGSLTGLATGSLGAGPGMSGNSPLAKLYRDGKLEQELSRLANEAFGTTLTLDRSNADVRLRIGRVENVPVPPIDNPTIAYSDAVAALPSLEQQGDGIKTFLGLALIVITGAVDVIVVDEPEAFLHPAQAKSLGRWLARQASLREIQIVVATHDRDFVLGLLEAAGDVPVTIIRATRTEDETHFRQLTSTELRTIWSDPVLRYSNVLQGLFYDEVCVCEGDADCRFYGAVLDARADETGARSAADNLMFVPSGGKQRIASLTKPLTSLGVKGMVIADFDVLNSRAALRSILESLGGQWTAAMNEDYVVFADAINGGSLWPDVKAQGLAAVPSGPPNAAAVRLLKASADQSVLIVPVGELESFDRTIGLEGAAWVSAMLEDHRHETNPEARLLIDQVTRTHKP